jgi:hypothetical protein
VQAEAVTERVNYSPHENLRFCTRAPNSPHVFAAALFGQRVCQYSYPAALRRLREAVKQTFRFSAMARAKGGGKAFPT